MRYSLAQVQEILREQLPILIHRDGVESLGVFGSFVRGENRDDSDLDVLVTFTETPSLFRFVELENHLTDVIGVKVDLVMRESLKPEISKRVLGEVVPI